MYLWTIQPESIYDQIQETGCYRCDISKSFMTDWKYHYDWLAGQMCQKIGAPPEGVVYPVWAWYKCNGRRKPDLEEESKENRSPGDKLVCMEIEIPENNVVLSDFDSWSIILLNGFISESEEENTRLEAYYDMLNTEEKQTFKNKNWERVFDINPAQNDWRVKGQYIQATFWELRKEDIKKVQHFISVEQEE